MIRTRLLVEICRIHRLACCLESLAAQTTYLPSGEIETCPLMSSPLIFPPVVSAVNLAGPSSLGRRTLVYSPNATAPRTSKASPAVAAAMRIRRGERATTTECTSDIGFVVRTSDDSAVGLIDSSNVAWGEGVECMFGYESAGDECAGAEWSRSDGEVGSVPASMRCFSRFNLP